MENGQVSSFSQSSTTEVELSVTPEAPGDVSVTVSAVFSSSGIELVDAPTLTIVYKGVSISSPSILAYSRYALLSVTTTKQVELYVIHYSRSVALTPESSLVITSGQKMQALSETSYTLNITDLTPSTDYVAYVAGREPFGPLIANSVADTRIAFSTVKDGDKPSEGKQCPKGWNLSDGLLLYAQCSDQGMCLDSGCICYAPYTGESCQELAVDGSIAANSTHHILHTTLTMYVDWGENSDDELIAYLKTSIRLAASAAADVSSSSLAIRVWEMKEAEEEEENVESKMIRGLEKRRRGHPGILPYIWAEESSNLRIHVLYFVRNAS